MAILVFLLLIKTVFSQDKTVEYLPNKLSVVLQDTNQGDEIFFYFLVKTGSLNETKKELGYAHFIEHLAFKKTQNFKKGVDFFFRSRGLEPGRHYNAITNYDYTVYQVKLPKAVSKMLLKDVILFFKDVLNGLLLDQKDIDVEKKVILAEKLKRGLPQKKVSLKLGSSLYLNRLPIGTSSSINKAISNNIRSYYNNWYQPKNCSLVVLGDFDKGEVLNSIREYLSFVPNTSLVEQKRVSVFKKLKNKLVVDSDKSFKNGISSVLFAFHVSKSCKFNKLNNCFIDVLKRRIRDAFNDKGLNATITYDYFLSDVSFLDITSDLQSSTNKIVEVAFTELKRLKEFGVSKKEFKEIALASKHKNNEKLSNDFLIDRLIDSINKPEFFHSHIIVNYDDLLAYKKKFFDNVKHLVYVQNNKGNFTKNDIKDAIKMAESKEVKKSIYVSHLNQKISEVKTKDLVVNGIKAIKPNSIKFFRSLGVSKISYKNGLDVFLKPIPDGSKKVTLVANSIGGYNDIADREYYKYASSEAYVGLGGVANLTYEDKGTYKFTHNISITQSISDFDRQIYATFDQKKQNQFFKYLYAVLVESKIDEKEFKMVINDEIAGLINSENKLVSFQKDRIVGGLTGEYFPNRKCVTTADDYLELDVNQMFEFYKKSFSYVDNWNYLIVGDFSIDSLTSILNVYLSNLKKSKDSFKNDNFNYRDSPDKQNLVVKGENKNQVVVMCIPTDTTLKSRLLHLLFKNHLSRQLSKLLRVKYGLLYSPPSVSLITRQTNNPVAIFKIEYSCGVQHFLKSKYYLNQFLIDFSISELTESMFLEYKRKIKLDFDSILNSKEHHLWGKLMIDNYFKVEELDQMPSILNSITRKAFVNYIQKFNKLATIKEFCER